MGIKYKFTCPKCASSRAFYTSRPLTSHDNDPGGCLECDQVCKMNDWVVAEWKD